MLVTTFLRLALFSLFHNVSSKGIPHRGRNVPYYDTTVAHHPGAHGAQHRHAHRSPFHRRKGVATIPETGQNWGNLVINNYCDDPLNVWSVGAWNLGGTRDPGIGFGTEEEQVMHNLPAKNGTWTEPFRVTCSNPENYSLTTANDVDPPWAQNVPGFQWLVSSKMLPGTNKPYVAGYCIPEDKLAGQGVAIKITNSTIPEAGKIIQLEYTLVQDFTRHDTYHRFNYDVSLLDCGPVYDNYTDYNATGTMLREKFDHCPGYKGGLSVTFSNDTVEHTNCPPTFCSADQKCWMAYMWDKTRHGEPSLSCEREYWGDMTLNLCVGNAQNKTILEEAKKEGDQWQNTAMNLPSGISTRPNGQPVGGATPTSAPPPPAATSATTNPPPAATGPPPPGTHAASTPAEALSAPPASTEAATGSSATTVTVTAPPSTGIPPPVTVTATSSAAPDTENPPVAASSAATNTAMTPPDTTPAANTPRAYTSGIAWRRKRNDTPLQDASTISPSGPITDAASAASAGPTGVQARGYLYCGNTIPDNPKDCIENESPSSGIH